MNSQMIYMKIKWIIKKNRNLFRLKSKDPPLACVIYEGICTCKENYIAGAKRNVEIQEEEHLGINKISESSRHLRHLKSNPTHEFSLNVLVAAPNNDLLRKNLEASFIALSRPYLNEQIDSKKRSFYCEMVLHDNFYSFNL